MGVSAAGVSRGRAQEFARPPRSANSRPARPRSGRRRSRGPGNRGAARSSLGEALP